MNGVLRDLLQWGIYKKNQGRVTRQATGAVLGLLVALGVWRLSVQWITLGPVFQYLIPGLLLAAGLWLAYRVVNLPQVADFLIAVEAEINKVSWPSRGELWRSSVVVILAIFALAATLFVYDFLWTVILKTLGVA